MPQPQQEIKQLSGALNLDDPNETLGHGFHKAARNILFTGTPPNRRVGIVAGNDIRINSLLPGAGVNKTILSKYDPVNKCIYFFNFNSNGSHGIYRFNTIPETFQRLIQVGINTSGDPLGFTAETLHNFDIIYGDSLQGDILYWLDSLGRPSKINVARALAGGYGTIQRSFLDVAKEPSDTPPYAIYENDPACTVNGMRKKLFKFKVRHVFDDHDKSVTSSQSEVPIPFAAFDQGFDADPTKCCRIALTFQTGAANVKKIELLAAVSTGNAFSDFFLIQSLDKAVSSIPSNDVSTFLFYNDQGYNNIDIDESDQPFDYVPLKAVAQTLLNGNVLDYGNITEGYPNLTNFSFGGNTSSLTPSQVPYYYGNSFSNLIAAQQGASGFGSGEIHIVVRGIMLVFVSVSVFTVYMTDGTNVNYTLSSGDDSAAVIEGLRVDAISKGYTINGVGANDLYITKAGVSLARSLIVSDYIYNTINPTAYSAYDWLSKYGFALVYFDDKERTNGAVYTSGFSVNAAAYTEGTYANKPSFNASIYHAPPDWAYSYQWVRTKDLAKSKTQQWITDRTFKDTTVVSGQIKYAYVSIESLNQFVEQNPGSPLGYGFSAGDRIRFFKRYNADNSTANLYGTSKDYEIVASLVNPTINGEVKSGQFIKFILPSTSGAFDFGTTGFANYFIELYTPAQSVANNLNLYYEFGERYAVANPTASNRFHQGMLQNQIYNTTTPATFEFTRGDYYAKQRAVQAGNVYTWNITTNTGTVGRFLFGMDFIDSTYVDSNITAQSVAWANISGNSPSGGISPGSDSRWFLKAIANTTFAIKGSISLNFGTSVPGDTWRIFLLNRYNERQYIVNNFNASAAGVYNFPINDIKTLEDDRIFLIAEGGERPVTVLSSVLTFSIDHVIPQIMIDRNFSDYFPSAVNSNGRAWIYDENANQVTFPVMYRWSLPYQVDTNINQANRFYGKNFDEVTRSYGPLMAMRTWKKQLTFFQERKCGQTGIYTKFISDNSGGNQLITTDEIVTKDNVNYYDGDYGVGNQPTSIVQSGYVFYLVDPIKNKILRLSRDGLVDLTELYKVQTWASQNLPKYLNPGTYAFGGNQKVLGVFNARPDNIDEYILLAQGTGSVAGEVMPFEEAYNSFYGQMDIDCDGMVCAESNMFYFRGGILYKQVTTTAPANFFGVQNEPSLTLVFNDKIVSKKVYNAIGYMSDGVWHSNVKGDIQTNSINSQTGLSQQSLIMSQDYDSLEAPKRYAAFNKDMNSNADPITGLWEGDELTGEYIVCKFKFSGNTQSFLYAPFITYQIDNRNP